MQDDPPPIIKRVTTVIDPRGDQGSPSFIRNKAQASRFLAMATFGGSTEDIDALVGRDATDWLAQEFAKPRIDHLPHILPERNNNGFFDDQHLLQDRLWLSMMTGDDQLRMRMTFALSQIFATSQEMSSGNIDQHAFFVDALQRNAFGNYRTLLGDVTFSPMMAQWLTYFTNRKGDPETGRVPDENYAREILQLFSIGLVELDRDGTVRTNGQGDPIATYDNDDVVGLARVFTGLGYNNGNFGKYPLRNAEPLVMYDEHHSTLEKKFLGTIIAENTDGITSINRALDTIANHSNVAPFISRQLIQRFTASNPSPQYIERVAIAFETGRYLAENGARFGTGTRGDFEAVLAAILLDEFVWTQPEIQQDFAGKVREPILSFVHIIRALNFGPIVVEDEYAIHDTRAFSKLGQQMLRTPSVFNFYRPGYVAPQTEAGERQLTAPEMQLVNASSSTGYVNFTTRFILGFVDDINFKPDFTTELSLADDPQALVRHLDLLLTGNRLSDTAFYDIVNTVGSLSSGRPDRLDRDRLLRVRVAVLMITASPSFLVIQ